MIGVVYEDRGRRAYRQVEGREPGLVRVLARWRGRGPRNVLVQPVDPVFLTPIGEPYVRPFRGLRRPPVVQVVEEVRP